MKMAAALLLFALSLLARAAPPREINLDYGQVKGPRDKFFNLVVGAGRAAEVLRGDFQRDLAVVHKECGFRYLRFHGLLQDELGVYNEDAKGNPVYNFQYVDAIYDALLNTGLKPFVEFGFMPERLASGDKHIFWWRGNITPPKDYAKWGALIAALTRHWTERYGAEEVKQWYFEVWNEPNLKDAFWSGTQEDYFKLYETTARAVKSVSPAYRVGGPATAGRDWIKEMIDFAATRKLPLDFITTHDYGVRGALDEYGVQQLYLDASAEAISGGVREVRAQIKASALPALPLHYTEWSASYSPRDPVHDAYVSAPYILSKLKGSEGLAESMSYWTFTDIFEEPGPVPSPFHGGFGLLNFQGLRKPAFYAYQFLNRLGAEELRDPDAASWAARDTNGAQVLLWHYAPPQTKESNQVLYTRDLPAKDAGTVKITLSGLPKGAYQLKIYRVGYQANDVYTSYLKLGAPANLSREQVRELAAKNDGRPLETSNVTLDKSQVFTRELPLRENDVYLLLLENKGAR